MHKLFFGSFLLGALVFAGCSSSSEDDEELDETPGKGEELEGTLGERTCAALEGALSGALVEADLAGRPLVFNIDYPEGWRRDGYGSIFSPQRDLGDGGVIAINIQQRKRVDDDEAYFQELIDLFSAVDVGTADYGGETIRIMREQGDGGHYTLLPHGDGFVELWFAHGGKYDDSACPDAIYQLKERLLQHLRPNPNTTFE